MQEAVQPIALLCSDLHLSHNKPLARDTDDWYQSQKDVLVRLAQIQKRHNNVPIVMAGDIFDQWKSPPQLINFAIDNMPKKVFAIPGQHDCPYHNYEDLENSAYWTLVKTKTITNLEYGIPLFFEELRLALFAFPWGKEVAPLPEVLRRKDFFHLAVAHTYIWKNRAKAYPGAPNSSNVISYEKKLRGYNAAVFGDNHISFSAFPSKKCAIYNTGKLMRRTINDVTEPRVAIIYSNGNFLWVPLMLDEKLIISSRSEREDRNKNLQQALKKILRSKAKIVDFARAAEHLLESNDSRITEEVRQLIIQALEISKDEK